MNKFWFLYKKCLSIFVLEYIVFKNFELCSLEYENVFVYIIFFCFVLVLYFLYKIGIY